MEPVTPDFILLARLFQQETNMRNLLIATCCAALVGSVSIASAQTANPTAQDTAKAASGPADSNANMKNKKTKSSMKSDDGMKGEISKDGMKKDTK